MGEVVSVAQVEALAGLTGARHRAILPRAAPLPYPLRTQKDGLVHNNMRSIFQDREGNLWFGAVGGGVSRYDGHTFTTFNTFDGLAHNIVLSIFEDREGTLWFGTESGASRYNACILFSPCALCSPW